MATNPRHPYRSATHKIIDELYNRGACMLNGFRFTGQDVLKAHKELFPEAHLPFKVGDRVVRPVYDSAIVYEVKAIRVQNDVGTAEYVCVPEGESLERPGRFGFLVFGSHEIRHAASGAESAPELTAGGPGPTL